MRVSAAFRSRTRPVRIDSSSERTTSCKPVSRAIRSRKAITSGKFCSVSMCSSVTGAFSGKNAFCARRSTTAESLPPEKSSAMLRHSAAISRRTKIDSASSSAR